MRLSEKDKQGLKLIVLIVVLASVLVGFFVYEHFRKVEIYEDTMCPKRRAVPEVLILIDKTDPLSDTQRAFVWKRISQIAETLELYERLSIYVLSDDRSTWSAAPLFAICNPGSTGNPLYQTEWQIHKNFRLKFGGPLESVLESLLVDRETKYSPIMEMVESLSLKTDVNGLAPRRRLVIISDMMQNTPAYSHYRLPIDYPAFSNSDYARQQKVNLSNAEASIIYLERESRKNYQSAAHVKFWEQWLHRNGAKLVAMERVR
jgi:hypothetical protein